MNNKPNNNHNILYLHKININFNAKTTRYLRSNSPIYCTRVWKNIFGQYSMDIELYFNVCGIEN